jgi:hypothetical protein
MVGYFGTLKMFITSRISGRVVSFTNKLLQYVLKDTEWLRFALYHSVKNCRKLKYANFSLLLKNKLDILFVFGHLQSIIIKKLRCF